MEKTIFKLALNLLEIILYIALVSLIFVNYLFYDKEPTNMQILIILLLHINIGSIESVFPDEKNS